MGTDRDCDPDNDDDDDDEEKEGGGRRRTIAMVTRQRQGWNPAFRDAKVILQAPP